MCFGAVVAGGSAFVAGGVCVESWANAPKPASSMDTGSILNFNMNSFSFDDWLSDEWHLEMQTPDGEDSCVAEQTKCRQRSKSGNNGGGPESPPCTSVSCFQEALLGFFLTLDAVAS